MSLKTVLEKQRTALESEEKSIVAAAEKRAEEHVSGDGKTATVTQAFTDSERERLQAIHSEIEQIDGDLQIDRQAREHARSAPAVLQEGPVTPVGNYPRSLVAGLADQFTNNEVWKEYVAKAAPNGKFGLARVESPKVEIEGDILRRGRPGATLLTGASLSAGELYVPQQTGILDEGTFQRELTILDVITRGTTDSDSVEYVRITGFTNNAAPVADADSTDPADTTGLKPESAMTFLRVAETVKTIAHWIPAIKNALADAGQLRTIVDQFLRYGLMEEVEDQIISGSGSGENFAGILDYSGSGLGSQAFDTDVLTTTRRARTKVRTGGRARANAYLFHPNDWEEIDLALTLEGGGTNNRQASETSIPRLWGLPVVESEAVPEGTGIVGDFRLAVLWDRMQTTIQASDGVENFFLKNMVAILAELRAAFGVIRPAAFVEIDLSSGS